MGAEGPGDGNPRRSDSASSLQTIGAIFSAVQSITSTKWAEEGVSRAAAVSSDLDTARAADGTIPWEAVERHCTPASCWIVVKDKVRLHAVCACEPQRRVGPSGSRRAHGALPRDHGRFDARRSTT